MAQAPGRWLVALLIGGGWCVALPLGAQVSSASMVGVVRDTAGVPIANAELAVDSIRARTDSLGRYYLAFPSRDSVTVTVRRVGYERLTFTVATTFAARNSIEVRMRALAQVLPAVEVEEAELRSRTVMEGFDRRRAQGHGVYVTRERIESMGGQQLSNILRGERGVTIVRARNGRSVLRFSQWRSRPNCEPQIWVDGRLVKYLEIDDIPAADVEGVELYDGPSSTPGEFIRGPMVNCGTVVIWSRVPMLQKP